MVANSSNLIITVKPANQHTLSQQPRRGSFSRNSGVSSAGSHLSQVSHGSQASRGSHQTVPSDDDAYDVDEIKDLTQATTLEDCPGGGSGGGAGGSRTDEGVLHLWKDACVTPLNPHINWSECDAFRFIQGPVPKTQNMNLFTPYSVKYQDVIWYFKVPCSSLSH